MTAITSRTEESEHGCPLQPARTCRNQSETERIAEALAEIAEPGDCYLLSGPIGAGKSVFARSFIQARLRQFGLYEEVPSPTYTLVQIYQAGPVQIWHSDLFRLNSPAEVTELALQDAFPHAISLVEWPDRLGGLAPRDAVRIAFEHIDAAPGGRLLRFKHSSGRIGDCLRHA
ncbi:MAG: tRNA (adenosine(37)-N6)-threonylcarbamoyltransferase complex ATPase subunit type 1 TsaE [Rhodobacteraceae bacterium]|nr:tRNA (adenosine(37)-N6)-threonylcarbamoyltransferase complex ATPase subunit type 1 TsaE [Paracoccaceae bacterium]